MPSPRPSPPPPTPSRVLGHRPEVPDALPPEAALDADPAQHPERATTGSARGTSRCLGLGRVFDRTPDELNHGLPQGAPRARGPRPQARAGKGRPWAAELDALLVCTCTGYLCPGLTSYVAEELGLPPERRPPRPRRARLRRGEPHARAASHLLAAQPRRHGRLRRRGGLLGGILPRRRSRRPDQRLPLQRWRRRRDLALGARAHGGPRVRFPLAAPAGRARQDCASSRGTGSCGTSSTAPCRSSPRGPSDGSGRTAGRGRWRASSATPAAGTSSRRSAPVVAPHSLEASVGRSGKTAT